MKERKPRFNRKILLISCLATVISSLFIGVVFSRLYSVSKKNILSKWSNDTLQFSQQVAYYMKMPMDAVAFSGVTINDMMARGKSHEEVGQYLINETAIYSSVISDNNTGVYGFYKGVYLDGSGWIPPDDYQPKERPWYTAAVEGKGEVVLVKPFLNLQTFTMMMSVSQLLNDGESVVSMDIFLDSVQNAAEQAHAKAPVEAVIVTDKNGFIVAHSDKGEVGKNVSSEGTELQKHILSEVLNMEGSGENNEPLSIKKDGKRFTVFSEQINDDWHSIFILNDSRLYHSLAEIYLMSGIVIILVLTSIFILFIRISRKYEEAEQLAREVTAVADIYVTVLKIDYKEDTIQVIRGNEDVELLLQGNFTGFKAGSQEFAERMSAAQSKEIMKSFMDVNTLEERLSGVNSISQEFMDDRNRWIRLRFIKIDEDENGGLYHILLAFESIDEDRRRQEKLRRLSETDMMTGIRNRGSGENMIRQAMAEGRKGMFCLMDADKFKSINDNYGHAVGDKVIKEIANALSRTFRDSDVVFRLGGDEFAVFSEGVVTEDIGRRIMERLFKKISAIEIPELCGRKIELSVGASFYPATQEDSFEDLYRRADNGTYESKTSLGNAVTFKV